MALSGTYGDGLIASEPIVYVLQHLDPRRVERLEAIAAFIRNAKGEVEIPPIGVTRCEDLARLE